MSAFLKCWLLKIRLQISRVGCDFKELLITSLQRKLVKKKSSRRSVKICFVFGYDF